MTKSDQIKRKNVQKITTVGIKNIRKLRDFTLKRDFCSSFSAKMFNLPLWSFFTLKIYMLDYVKKYMGPLRFFGTQKKMLANLCIFENQRFLRGHNSKPPFSRNLFLTFIYTFSSIF